MGYLSCNAHSSIATCHPHHKPLAATPIRHFPYADIVAAANGFSSDTFLGRGSHGRVYRATLDAGKLLAAVKTTKLVATSTSKNHATKCTGCGNCTSPAENEIEILSQIPSPRLVNLIDFSTDPNDNKLLVKYMPNGGRNVIDVNFSTLSVVDWAMLLIKTSDFAGTCHCRIGPPPDPAVVRHLAVLAARCVRS